MKPKQKKDVSPKGEYWKSVLFQLIRMQIFGAGRPYNSHSNLKQNPPRSARPSPYRAWKMSSFLNKFKEPRFCIVIRTWSRLLNGFWGKPPNQIAVWELLAFSFGNGRLVRLPLSLKRFGGSPVFSMLRWTLRIFFWLAIEPHKGALGRLSQKKTLLTNSLCFVVRAVASLRSLPVRLSWWKRFA